MGDPCVCYDCSARYDSIPIRCGCGEPLWFESPDDQRDLNWQDLSEGSRLQRYGDLLPVVPESGIASGVGGTPLVRSETLGSELGADVYIKLESHNPTGAYKDRGSAIALTYYLKQDVERVGTVSYGNMAISTAAHAADNDLECLILVPDDIQSLRLELIDQFDPTIIQVEGYYGDLYYRTVELSDVSTVQFINSDDPARIAGYKTCLFEICQQLQPTEPDAIVLPNSSGGFASGIWKGIKDLQSVGLLESAPRLYLVETAAVDPTTEAFESGAKTVKQYPEADITENVAHSIGNPDPPSGNRALTAVRETGGRVLSVSNDEILSATESFAVDCGFCVEPAAAAPLAAARKLRSEGEFDDLKNLVLVPTGTGFKELGTGSASVNVKKTVLQNLEEYVRSTITD